MRFFLIILAVVIISAMFISMTLFALVALTDLADGDDVWTPNGNDDGWTDAHHDEKGAKNGITG